MATKNDDETPDLETEQADAPTVDAEATEDYTLSYGTYTRYEGPDKERKLYRRGDTISLTADEAKSLGVRAQRVAQPGQYNPTIGTDAVEADTEPGEEVKTGAPEGVGTAPGASNANDWSFLAGQPWQDAVTTIQALESKSDVEAARAAEASGKNRKSVIEAADSMLESMPDEESSTEG